MSLDLLNQLQIDQLQFAGGGSEADATNVPLAEASGAGACLSRLGLGPDPQPPLLGSRSAGSLRECPPAPTAPASDRRSHGQAHVPAAPQGRSHPHRVHAYWQDVHGPLIKSSKSGSHVVRYEQHPRPLSDYKGDADAGFDGVTVQWFESKEDYQAHMAEPDFPDIWADIGHFLDTEQLHFIVTEHPRVVMGDDGSFPLA